MGIYMTKSTDEFELFEHPYSFNLRNNIRKYFEDGVHYLVDDYNLALRRAERDERESYRQIPIEKRMMRL